MLEPRIKELADRTIVLYGNSYAVFAVRFDMMEIKIDIKDKNFYCIHCNAKFEFLVPSTNYFGKGGVYFCGAAGMSSSKDWIWMPGYPTELLKDGVVVGWQRHEASKEAKQFWEDRKTELGAYWESIKSEVYQYCGAV